MERIIKENMVKVCGCIVEKFQYSHEVFGEKFYTSRMKVERLSGMDDLIPIMVSERLVDVTVPYENVMVSISGNFRSYNEHDEDNNNHLILSVFAREFEIVEPEIGCVNEIEITGYVCKQPSYRKTPLGREITDMLIAINRPYGRSDYIPCIAWGRNARYALSLEVGDKVELSGRIQSRQYQKKLSDTEFETKTAYEVSVSRIVSYL